MPKDHHHHHNHHAHHVSFLTRKQVENKSFEFNLNNKLIINALVFFLKLI